MSHIKGLLLIFIFSGLFTGFRAQNLVPNNSFEDFNTCKYMPFDVLDSIFSGKGVVNAWVRPNNGSPDFFHPCFESPSPSVICSLCYSVPVNVVGYQYPRTGSAYMGIAVAKLHAMEDDREYIQTVLKRPLAKGRRYCAGFFTSLANLDSVVELTNASHAACGNWGMLLTKERPHDFIRKDEGPIILSILPQVKVSPPLRDTANWVLIHKEIVAEGGEQWLTIGNFSPHAQLWFDTIRYGSFGVASYYYIDDVFVIPMDDGGLLGADTLVCQSSLPLQVRAFDGFSNYEWSNGDTSPITTIEQPGVYVVKASHNSGCMITDTIRVEVLPPPSLQLPVLTYCPSELPASFTAPSYPGISHYLWSDGFVGATRSIAGPGQWVLRLSGECGFAEDTLRVRLQELPEVNIGDVYELCASGVVQPITLSNIEVLDNYRWSTGDTTSFIVVDRPGRYRLETATLCGIMADEAVVNGCDVRIYFPNVFSPSANDPVNRVFRPEIFHGELVSLSIYDRWGNWLYEGYGSDAVWDGTVRGRLCESGVYVCRVIYRAYNEQGLREIVQSVTLIR